MNQLPTAVPAAPHGVDDTAVDVLVLVQSDDRIRLEWPDGVAVRTHPDPRPLRAALRSTGGFARWRPGRQLLAVPAGPGRSLLFGLAAPAPVVPR
ncbi:hypothetical protein ACFWPA_03875 [Rhodococcus sp. NPDC058505]|uniref:hypothetical protein n=1 Tax=unclassified Rhodococcus (in: high G+C Gram-positive bacteria) TaxID=192944 RepID=UPI0036474DC9